MFPSIVVYTCTYKPVNSNWLNIFFFLQLLAVKLLFLNICSDVDTVCLAIIVGLSNAKVSVFLPSNYIISNK